SSDFDSAAEIAKRFCPKGTLLFTIKQPKAKQERMFTSNQDPQFQGVIAVLVDRETAGAQEVIAALLRSQAGALVIGETTRGQAVEYVDLPLHDGKMLRVAEALAILPGSNPIFPEGVKPDLVVRLSAADKNEIMKQSLDKGISQFVFETERPKMNEAALVAGINPEIDAIEAAQGKKPDAKPALRDTVLQRAVDFITTVGFYKAVPGAK
ncbi:MAG: S41 family peptidase, partial [Verrucomicrobiota bacterium]